MQENNSKDKQYQVDGRKYENLIASSDGSLVGGISDSILTIWNTATGKAEELTDISSLLPLSMRRRGKWKICFSSKATYIVLSFEKESYEKSAVPRRYHYCVTTFYWVVDIESKKIVYQSNANNYEGIDEDFLPGSVMSDNEQWFVYWGDVFCEHGSSFATDIYVVNLQTGDSQLWVTAWVDFAAITDDGVLAIQSYKRAEDCFTLFEDFKTSASDPESLDYCFFMYDDFDYIRDEGKYRMEITEQETSVNVAVIDTEADSLKTIFTDLSNIELYLFGEKHPNILGAVSNERLKIWSLETTECLYDFVIRQSNDYSISVTSNGVFIEHPTQSSSELFFLN